MLGVAACLLRLKRQVEFAGRRDIQHEREGDQVTILNKLLGSALSARGRSTRPSRMTRNISYLHANRTRGAACSVAIVRVVEFGI